VSALEVEFDDLLEPGKKVKKVKEPRDEYEWGDRKRWFGDNKRNRIRTEQEHG
jgi:hypothetical protein